MVSQLVALLAASSHVVFLGLVLFRAVVQGARPIAQQLVAQMQEIGVLQALSANQTFERQSSWPLPAFPLNSRNVKGRLHCHEQETTAAIAPLRGPTFLHTSGIQGPVLRI